MGILDSLKKRFNLRKRPELTSCPRRTEWTKDDPPNWRIVRANALLGWVNQVQLEAAGHEYFAFADSLLAFRAGPWKGWWTHDLLWEAAGLGLSGVTLLWENNDEITIVELTCPDSVLEPDRIGDPPRIRKDFPKSGICWYCPVREKCDAWDEIHDQRQDWPEKWRKRS